MAIFRTLESSLSFEDWKNELVFVFGNADADKRIPDQYLFRIPNCKFVNPKKFCSTIDPKLWGNGFTFIADATVGRKDGLALQTVQMNLIKAYYSYHFKNTTPYTPPAVITALQGGLTDPTRSLNQLKNMPWLLRYPLADKICKKNIGLPVLIVMPGHSVIKVQSDIKRLAQKCLVICIARSLKICLAAGVEPDFVVQYDTHLEQRHFYETIPLLKNTVLVSLSSASISGYAWKFRGVVFRASFNQLILSNDFVMRDGSEGSLLACLGLAEALRAPMVCMAGCDFSWKPHQDIYDPNEAAQHETNSHTEDYRITPEVLRSEYLMPGRFRVVNRDGQVVCSTIGYVAAAAKASEFADDIQTLVGTKFYLLSHDGILH
ncbi:MAG: DUF115 domain-containing protein, partial [Proteobacteria bacterium]|nr:DUF115 domain-containing protein [Pseudomonadota bacterium]